MRQDREQRTEVPTACPFVAFAEERDLRASEPDHEHRCYVESPPAPRALAHQERYCLSPDFPSCPIFQDWALRSAARAVDDAAPAVRSSAAPELPGLFDEPAPAPVTSPEPLASKEFGAAATLGMEAEEQGEDLSLGGLSAVTSRAGPWDRPRRREVYPRLRRASAGVPPILVGLVLLAVAAGLLFLLPGFVAGLFSGSGTAASPTPSATPVESPTEPTPEPAPTPLVYVVKSGDTLTKIANRFDVTVDELLAANPQIADPNRIKVGDPITIPTAPPEGEASASPTP